MLADAARQRCAKSWLLTIPVSRSSAALTYRLRGVSTVSSSNEHATLPSLEQLATLGPEKVNATADPVQIGVPSTESEAEVAPHTALNRVSKDLRNQVGEIVRPIFRSYSSIFWKFAIQIGGVQHQQPDVPDRNSAYGPDGCCPKSLDHRPASNPDFADSAF